MASRLTPEVFLDALAADTSPDQLWQLAVTYLDDIGFDRVIHLSTDGKQGPPSVNTNMPLEFVSTYQSEGFASDDPFLLYCLPSTVSIETGVDHMDDYDYLTGRARDLIALAGESGFRAGFSLTTRRAGLTGVEGWNVGSSLGHREVAAIRKHRGQEISLALMALRGRLSDALQCLTTRETQAMRLLIEGHRTREIAARLGIREVTVEFHLGNVKRKLGAPTREAAVARFLGS